METTTIYNEEEIAMRKEVTDETLGAELDRRYKELTEAKTIDELCALRSAAEKWISSVVVNAENHESIDTVRAIIKNASTRLGIKIILDKSESQAEITDGA